MQLTKHGGRMKIELDSYYLDRSSQILTLGSCFAANISFGLCENGYEVLSNPFGTIFNPASILNSMLRLQSRTGFNLSEAIQLGAGSDLWGSFCHYTKFAKPTKEEFIESVNQKFLAACDFYQSSSHIILTFGTSWCFFHTSFKNKVSALSWESIVANCLKRSGEEFERKSLTVEEIVSNYSKFILSTNKKFILTVSPIRHPVNGVPGDTVSKAILILACDLICRQFPDRVTYFPAYEIMRDELRNYSYYADDLCHPSPWAISYVQKKFLEWINGQR